MADEYLHGLGALQATFLNRKVDIRDKTARRIVAAGGGELKKEAKSIVNAKGLIRSRALINNIVIKRETNVPPGVEQYNLGVRHGRAMGNGKKILKYLAIGKSGRVVVKRQNDPFYWRFLEFGHKIVPRSTGKQGVVESIYSRFTKNGKVRSVKRQVGADAISIRRRNPTGFVDATPFIGPALVSGKLKALAAMERQALKLAEITT